MSGIARNGSTFPKNFELLQQASLRIQRLEGVADVRIVRPAHADEASLQILGRSNFDESRLTEEVLGGVEKTFVRTVKRGK